MKQRNIVLSAFSLALTLASQGAWADVTLILSPLQSGAEGSISAIVANPLALSSSPVFGDPERKGLEDLGQSLAAQSLKVTVLDEVAARKLMDWAKTNAPQVLLENNSMVGLNSADDPLTRYQWGLRNSGTPQGTDLDDITTLEIPGVAGEDTGLLRAPNEATVNTRKIRVAVLDSGVDLTHPDLINQIAKKPSECEALKAYKDCRTAAGTTAAALATCDSTLGKVDSDGNGYPLDCNGWNVTTGKKGPTGVLGDSDPTDSLGHGTHVSGIIGASANGVGVLGMLNNIAIIPVRVIDRNPNVPIRPQDTGPAPAPSPGESDLRWSTGFADVIARGMLYAIRSDAQVINMSLAWPLSADSMLMRRMVQLAISRGILVVASAGNDSNDAQVMPCSYNGVICVAAHGPDGALSHFSNYGPSVDIAAPGLKILSTWPMAKRALSFTERPGYEYKNGTSMAAPMVTGLLARLLNDGFTPQEAYARLLLGARPTRSSTLRNAQMAPKFTRSGNVDLPAAFQVEKQPLILPATKELIRIAWDRHAVEIPVSVTLKNYWGDAGQVQIDARISQNVPGAQYAQLRDSSFQQGAWASGAEKTFSTALRILDGRVDGRLIIELTVRADQFAERTFRVPVEITVPIKPGFSDPEFETFPIIGAINSGASLRTITSNAKASRNEYLALVRGATQWKAQIIAEEAHQYRVSASVDAMAALEGELFLINRLSGESSGTDSYVFINRLSPLPGGGSGKRFAFNYFDANLQPINSLVYDNVTSTLNERFQWLMVSDAGQSRLVPAWVAIGKTPDAELPDRSRDPWHLIPDDVAKYRFYYFGRDGKLHSVTAPTGYNFVEVLFASEDQRDRGEVPVILSKGEGYQVTYYRAVIQDKAVTNLEALNFAHYRNLQAATNVLEVIGLGRQGSLVGTAFSGVGVPGSLRTTVIPGISTQVTVDAGQDPLNVTESAIRAAGVFQGSSRAGVFTQTHYELQYHDLKNNQVANTSLNRFSFMPAFIQQKNFFPIVVGDRNQLQGERMPAVLIPSGLGDTLANEVIVPVQDSSGRLLGLSRPARLRLEDTRECISLGKPRLATPEAATQIVFFCGDKFLRTTLNY